MYHQVKLEKGMYHLSGKSFLQALEEADPSKQYGSTPLARLDAYERQLKRFDIRVSGGNCDRVEKFFTTTESAVLFPEFVRRSIVQGMEEAILDDMTAVVSKCESNRYQGCVLNETSAYATTSEGNVMPISAIQESSTVVSLYKFGRNITASYEAVRQQRIDVFALMLRRVGKELADSIVSNAVSVLITGVTPIPKTGETLAYADLAKLYGSFGSFQMKAVMASPAVMAQILVMSQMQKASSEDVTEIRLPFGSKLINCPQLGNSTIIGLDTDFALEQIRSSDVVLETDKLINCQLDSIGVSVNVGFRVLMPDAVKVLSV
ncbi:MAG TPA: hypothetical protein DCO72_02640 [Ruminococcus sp.]|nr:hypothetical protein [Ruminococcus sp.]